jgi:sugar/nucleoside kinase (ribokinase family)
MSVSGYSPSICLIGDLTLDSITHLSDTDLSSLDTSIYKRTSIELTLGGTVVHPAIAASQLDFSRVSLIGKIGVDPIDKLPDLAGQAMIEYLEQHNIQCFLGKDTKASTGKTIIMYFADDNRILVADRAANASFNHKDITPDLINVIETSDILFISGYWLMLSEQALTTIDLAKKAEAKGKLTVLDVVPHRIYQILNRDTFIDYTASIQVLVSEVNTVRRLFPEVEMFDVNLEVDKIAKVLLQYYKCVILRPSNDIQYVFDHQGLVTQENTGYSSANPNQLSGFLDKATIKLLLNHYARINGEEI